MRKSFISKAKKLLNIITAQRTLQNGRALRA